MNKTHCVLKSQFCKSSSTHSTAQHPQPKLHCFFDRSTASSRVLCLSAHSDPLWGLTQQDWYSQEPSDLCVLAFWADLATGIQVSNILSKQSAIHCFNDKFKDIPETHEIPVPSGKPCQTEWEQQPCSSSLLTLCQCCQVCPHQKGPA